MVKKFEFVNVPSTTLNALRNLLFTSENGGVDLSSIIKDLTIGDTNEDILAINVGLTFKGLKPEVDNAPRYGRDYRSLIRYDFVNFSMIMGQVTAKRVKIAEWSDEKNDLVPCEKDNYLTTFGVEDWLNKDADRTKSTKEIVERFAKKEEPKPQAI